MAQALLTLFPVTVCVFCGGLLLSSVIAMCSMVCSRILYEKGSVVGYCAFLLWIMAVLLSLLIEFLLLVFNRAG